MSQWLSRLNGPLWLLLGRLQEIRVFYEVWYLICLLALPVFFGPPDESRHPNASAEVC